MTAKARAQLAMDERVVEDKALSDALEARLRVGDDLSEIRKVYGEKDTAAKGLIEALGLSDGEVIRVGRFRVEKAHVDAKEVAFTSKETSRVRIRLNDD
jgi:hypothetical protein